MVLCKQRLEGSAEDDSSDLFKAYSERVVNNPDSSGVYLITLSIDLSCNVDKVVSAGSRD